MSYVLEWWHVGGEEEAQEGRVDHDHQRPQSPGYAHLGLTMLLLYILAHCGNLDDVRRAWYGPGCPACEDNLVAVLEVSGLPGGLDGPLEAVLQGPGLFPVDGDNTPHQREHPDSVLDGAYGQDLVGRPEAGDPYAREPRLGRGQDGFGLEVFCKLAGRVGNGVVAVTPPPGSRGRDVPPVVDSPFRGPADPLHLLHALHRVAPDGRLPGEHYRVGPIEDRVGHIRDLGARGTGVPDHGVEHLGSHDDRLAEAPAARHHAFLLYGDPLGGELDSKIPARDHYAVRGAYDLLGVVYGLVLLDLGDNGRVAAELSYPLLDLPDLVRRAHEGHRHPVRVELLHPETQILDVLGRKTPYGQGRVREVEPLVGRDRAAFQNLADDLAILDALNPQPDEAVVYEETVPGADIVGQVLVRGRETARVPREVSRGDHEPAALYQLGVALHFAGPDLGSLDVLQNGDVTPQLPGGAAYDLGVLQVHAVLAVGEVEPRHVHPGPHERPDGLLRRGGRTQGRDYLRPAQRQPSPPGLTLGLKAARPG